MKLLVINPNTDAALTDRMCGFAAEAVPDMEVMGATAPFGPDYIRTPEDSAEALRALEELFDGLSAGFDAAMIASSSDTGLNLARERLSVPVTAMTESAMTEAAALAPRFGFIGFQALGRTLMMELAAKYGVAAQFAGVRTAAAPTVAAVIEAGRAAIEEDGAGALIVGGASMCGHVDELTAALGMPVLDGVTAAARQARKMAGD